MATNCATASLRPGLIALGLLLAATVSTESRADPPASPAVVQNPNWNPSPGTRAIDLAPDAVRARPLVDPPYPAAIPFDRLDAYARPAPADSDASTALGSRLPPGMAQIGGMVVPQAMLEGADMVPDLERALAAEIQPKTGIEDICAFPEEVPPGVYDYEHLPGGETPRFHTVYLNFVGATLNTGGENSAENRSNIAISGHPFPVYAGGETLAIAVAQAIALDLERWAVRVVYLERPPKILPYTMVMIGGNSSDTTAGPSGGVAPLDCEDFGQRNVCYAFQNTQPATSQANVASQEIGHTMGLGHTSAQDSVMAAGYAPTQGGDLGFNDTCAPTVQVAGQGAACIGVNKCHCGDGTHQHDANTLFATFSPAGVDIVEPTIELVQPADGARFGLDEGVPIEVVPWDDVGGYGWKIMLEDEQGEVLLDQVDYDRQMVFELGGLPAGGYTLRAIIQDHADHVVEDIVTFVVGEADGGSGSDSGETGDTIGGGSEAGSGTAGSGGSSGAGPDSAPNASDDGTGGCGCATDTRAPNYAGLASLVVIGAMRRRRRAGS